MTAVTDWGVVIGEEKLALEEVSNFIQYQEEIGCSYNNAIKNLYLKLNKKFNPNYQI